MKTLLERADQRLLAGIERYAVKYPSTTEYVKKTLSELHFVNHMTISLWTDVRSIWFDETGELSNHPWDLFRND